MSPTEAELAYRDAWRIYILWMVAVAALQFGNTQVVLDSGKVRDFFYALAPWLPFRVAVRRQSERIGGGILPFDWVPIFLFKDPQAVLSATRATFLFSERTPTWTDFSQTTLMGGLFFAALAYPNIIAPIGVRLGWTPVDSVHWFQLAMNIAFLVTLSQMWIEMKKIHERVAATPLEESKK